MMKPLNWTQLTDLNDSVNKTMRMKVVGGWLVKNQEELYDGVEQYTSHICMVFVPDSEHTWDLIELVTGDSNV